MGNCFVCGKSITLKENVEKCPYCGQNPYKCWSCNSEISGAEEQCVWCGFKICNECGVCCNKNACPKIDHMIAIGEMSVEEIVDYFGKIKSGLERKNCPNGVPISYAKAKLRTIALKLQGYGVKSSTDKDAYESRFEELKQKGIGKSWTISQVRRDGEFGNEMRCCSNLMVCMGMAEVKTITKEDGEKYFLFIRREAEKCEHSDWDSLVRMRCPKCKKLFAKGTQQCDKCIVSKGKNKGMYVALKLHISKNEVDFCRLNRGMFHKKE